MDAVKFGCFKDLEGTIPCEDGDLVALVRTPFGQDLVQPLVAYRPVMRGGGPYFSPIEEDDSFMETKGARS